MIKHAFVFLRLELRDALRSKWLLLTSALYFALGGAFVWLGLRESSVLGFTGLSRVLLNLAHTVIVIFPLLVLIATHAAVVRGRTTGFCELMLVHPVRRASWLLGLLGSRLVVLVGPLVLLTVLCAIVALVNGDEPGLWLTAAKSLAICGALVFAFTGIGFAISTLARSPERALVWALVAFVLTAALHDVLLITALLRTPLPPEVVFGLAALNPSEAARVGVLASVDPELSVLGPVGFWLANTLGPARAVGLAVGWPVLLGLGGLLLAHARLKRSDLIA